MEGEGHACRGHYVPVVAILIVLEQGWKLGVRTGLCSWSLSRNPHCTGAGLEAFPRQFGYVGKDVSQSSLYWSRVGRFINLSNHPLRGWSQSSLYWSRVGRLRSTRSSRTRVLVAILIVLEQGWKSSGSSYSMNAVNLSQSSLYWSRVGS